MSIATLIVAQFTCSNCMWGIIIYRKSGVRPTETQEVFRSLASHIFWVALLPSYDLQVI